MSDKIRKTPIIPANVSINSPDDVIEAVADAFNCSYGEIVGNIKINALSLPREFCTALIRAQKVGFYEIEGIFRISHEAVTARISKFFKERMKNNDIAMLWDALAPDDFKGVRSLTRFNIMTLTSAKGIVVAKHSIEPEPISFEEMSREGSDNLKDAIFRYYKKYHSTNGVV